MPKILVIGIGNEYRGDDGVGVFVVRELAKARIPAVEVIEESGEGTALVEAWKDAESVFIIDAVCSGSSVGAIHEFDVSTEPIPTGTFHYSSHAFGLAEAIELSRAMNQLPSHIVVYGIEGLNFEYGVDLTPEVERAARLVVDMLSLKLRG
jgi:hydrogenase maturation protease